MIYLLVGIIIAMSIILIVSIVNNHRIQITKYVIQKHELPKSFNDFRITLLTDIHNEAYCNTTKFYNQVKVTKPDVIFISGDMIDSRRTDINEAIQVAQQLVKIAPTYYVNGNHEYRVSIYPEFEAKLKEIGVNVLRNQSVKFQKESESIELMGIDDPHFISKNNGYHAENVAVLQELEKLKTDDSYTILLSHRPEFFETFVEHKINLVLCGHTHGGQIRIPFVGGVIAPHQGFFPKYDAGLFVKENTVMIISKGLGRSSFPLRVNDSPEIVEILLKSN